MDNSGGTIQRSALIFPADGTSVRLVQYSIKERSEGDGSVDFYDYLPDLRPWLEPAFLERDFVDFHISNASSKEWLRCENIDTWGNYCLYYTTSSKLTVNQACKNIIKSEVATERLFFRGDVFLVKHTGSLGEGHEYIDTPQTMIDVAAKVIKKMYESESLEKRLEWDRKCGEAFEKHKLQHPDICSAIETGAVERFRTGQLTGNDVLQIAALEKYRVQFPDGSSKKLLG